MNELNGTAIVITFIICLTIIIICNIGEHRRGGKK